MKTFRWIVVASGYMAIACAAAAVPCGCVSASQQTPAQEVYNAQTALDAVVAGLDAAHAAGVLSSADEQKLALYVNAAAAALASLQTAVNANDSLNITAGLEAFDAAMQQLAAAKSRVPALSATAPSK